MFPLVDMVLCQSRTFIARPVPISFVGDAQGSMNADRVHGFCEGMAVTVGIAALGFIVMKEVDAFCTGRRLRHSLDSFSAQIGSVPAIVRRDHDNRNISDFHITSDTPLSQTQLAELIAQAMLFPSEETGENNETGDEEAMSGGLDD